MLEATGHTVTGPRALPPDCRALLGMLVASNTDLRKSPSLSYVQFVARKLAYTMEIFNIWMAAPQHAVYVFVLVMWTHKKTCNEPVLSPSCQEGSHLWAGGLRPDPTLHPIPTILRRVTHLAVGALSPIRVPFTTRQASTCRLGKTSVRVIPAIASSMQSGSACARGLKPRGLPTCRASTPKAIKAQAQTAAPPQQASTHVPPGLNKFSGRITQPASQGASQAMLYATGLNEADMNKPQVRLGVVGGWVVMLTQCLALDRH